jgi:DNA topoisomerase VI subunit B
MAGLVYRANKINNYTETSISAVSRRIRQYTTRKRERRKARAKERRKTFFSAVKGLRRAINLR